MPPKARIWKARGRVLLASGFWRLLALEIPKANGLEVSKKLKQTVLKQANEPPNMSLLTVYIAIT
jgi:hypothetical protein